MIISLTVFWNDRLALYKVFNLTLFQLQVNPKAAESLADPEEYSNLFDDWQVALAVESKAAATRY